MEVAIVDISANYAFFKCFDTTRGNISFPFPPRTALMGLIAGILGLKRNSYWNDHPLSNTYFGMDVLKPIKRIGVKMNYTQSRKVMSFDKKVKILLPAKPHHPDARGLTTQVRLDLLQDVAYRLYFTHPDTEFFEQICNALINHKYCYPPYLGHANLLCGLEWQGKYEMEDLNDSVQKVNCLIPTSLIENNILQQYGYFSLILQVPMEYQSRSITVPIIDEKRILIKPIRFENVIFQLFSDSGIEVTLKTLDYAFSVNINNDQRSIIFFPPH